MGFEHGRAGSINPRPSKSQSSCRKRHIRFSFQSDWKPKQERLTNFGNSEHGPSKASMAVALNVRNESKAECPQWVESRHFYAIPFRMGLKQRLWGALTGKSDQWFLTTMLSAAFGKLLMVAVLLTAFFAAGDEAISGSLEESSGRIRILDPARFLDVLVVAPIIESILLVFLIWLFGFKLRLRAAITVGLSAVVFVPMHGLNFASIGVLPAFVLWGLIQYVRRQHQ